MRIKNSSHNARIIDSQSTAREEKQGRSVEFSSNNCCWSSVMLTFIVLRFYFHFHFQPLVRQATSVNQQPTWTHLVNTIKSVQLLAMPHLSKHSASRFICRKISSTLNVLVQRRSLQRWWTKFARTKIWLTANTSFVIRAMHHRSLILIRPLAKWD